MEQTFEASFVEIKMNQLEQIVALTQQLNPDKSKELLVERQQQMFALDHYICFGLIVNNKLAGVAGGWKTVRLYSGKQLEIDHVVVDETYRSAGLGAYFLQEIESWATNHDCKTVELNAYVANSRSHKFYFDKGYQILGFHFQKKINTADRCG